MKLTFYTFACFVILSQPTFGQNSHVSHLSEDSIEATSTVTEPYQIIRNPESQYKFSITDLKGDERIALYNQELEFLVEPAVDSEGIVVLTPETKGTVLIVIHDRRDKRYIRKVSLN